MTTIFLLIVTASFLFSSEVKAQTNHIKIRNHFALTERLFQKRVRYQAFSKNYNGVGYYKGKTFSWRKHY